MAIRIADWKIVREIAHNCVYKVQSDGINHTAIDVAKDIVAAVTEETPKATEMTAPMALWHAVET